MRTVIFSINVSLDGYCDHTIFNPDEDLMGYFANLMEDVDLFFSVASCTNSCFHIGLKLHTTAPEQRMKTDSPNDLHPLIKW